MTATALTSPRPARDEVLARDGWTRRFTAAAPRIAEVRDLYDSLGLEVLLDPLQAGELAQDCEGCLVALATFRVVYTLPRGTGS